MCPFIQMPQHNTFVVLDDLPTAVDYAGHWFPVQPFNRTQPAHDGD